MKREENVEKESSLFAISIDETNLIKEKGKTCVKLSGCKAVGQIDGQMNADTKRERCEERGREWVLATSVGLDEMTHRKG